MISIGRPGGDQIYIQEMPVFTDVFCPEVGWETARDGFCVSCGATDHASSIPSAKSLLALAIELGEHPNRVASYATVHKAGCRDLIDPESIGEAGSLREIDALVVGATGWTASKSPSGIYERIAPCVTAVLTK